MNSGRYILDADRRAVQVESLLQWAEWLEKANRHVGIATIRGVRISTIFLALDYSFSGGDAQPVLWETMVFGGDMEGWQRRCAGNWEQAEAMHLATIALVLQDDAGALSFKQKSRKRRRHENRQLRRRFTHLCPT